MAGKKHTLAQSKYDRAKFYGLDEAVGLVKTMAYAKFDETVDLVFRLGVDPKHADQIVRGTVILPHGTGKSVRVLVFAQGEKEKEAQQAGADFSGCDDLIEKIQGGWMEFDTAVATPDVMGKVGRIGKILGPRGLMPNPKAGTVHVRRCRSGARDQGRTGGVPSRQGGECSRALRQGLFPTRKIARERDRGRRDCHQGEAVRGQRPLHAKCCDLYDDGSGHSA
jgi:hypothetical protein